LPRAGIPGANGSGVKPAPPVAVNPPPKPAIAPQKQGGGLTTGGLMQSTNPSVVPAPASTMYSGVGPLPANDMKKPPAPQQQVGQTGGLQPSPLPANTGTSGVKLQFEAGMGN
jgi:hypothetical protein